ncbi:MAG: nitroreductase family protein [Bulleidia sp.]
MNQISELLQQTRSMRDFEDREIPQDIRDDILACACAAPTGGNQQAYTIIDITDQNLKEKLAVSCDNQPFITKAKMVLLFCGDCRKWNEAYRSVGLPVTKPCVTELIGATTDAVIAAQNSVIAAAGHGIGSCYIGDIRENCETIRELLKLPEYVFPSVMVVYGYPTQKQLERTKPQRVPMESIVSENAYPVMDDDYLRHMFAYKTGKKDYAEWLTMMFEHKQNAPFMKEMRRSVLQYMKQFDWNEK